jgi:hypothetical protein
VVNLIEHHHTVLGERAKKTLSVADLLVGNNRPVKISSEHPFKLAIELEPFAGSSARPLQLEVRGGDNN